MNTTDFNNVEINYYDFYTLSLKYNIDPNDFSADDLENLSEIASKCPGTEGNVIYQAKGLYLQITGRVFNSANECAETGARMAKFSEVAKDSAQKSWRIDLFPNPLQNRLTITNSIKDEILDVAISDLTGRIIIKQKLKCEGNSGSLNLDLVNGSYIITISNSSNEYITKQILIFK